MMNALGLEDDLRPVAARLVRELGAQLVDVHILSPLNDIVSLEGHAKCTYCYLP